MSKPAIVLEHVNKSFGEGALKSQILFDISLQLFSGELTLIVGPSGCGKTTLISLMVGVLEHDSGTIDLFGTRISDLNDGQKTAFRRNRIGYIFQTFNLVPTLTVLENAALPLLIQGQKRTEAFAQAAEILKTLELANRLDYLPRNLSGGQQQRVSIARALIVHPQLIVCDEPTASLDSHTGHTVMSELKALSQDLNRAVIVVTHDSRIFEFGDRMVRMDDGRIIGVETLKGTAA